MFLILKLFFRRNTLRPSCNSFPNNQARMTYIAFIYYSIEVPMLLGQRFRDTHSTSDSALQGYYSQYEYALYLYLP